MAIGLLGRKVGMMQWFDASGNGIAATVIAAEPNVITQIKTDENDGYTALQLGFGKAKEKNVTQPLKGHFKKANADLKKYTKEFRVEDVSQYQVGQQVNVGIFQAGDIVRASGMSKGKGFQGVMARWGFAGGFKSHGSDAHRRPGGIGTMRATGKILKNKKMAGRMGYDRITVRGLTVLKADPERNLVVVKGAVPGPTGCLVELRKDA